MKKIYKILFLTLLLSALIIPQISYASDKSNVIIGQTISSGAKYAIGIKNSKLKDIDDKILTDGILNGVKFATGKHNIVIGEGIKVGARLGIGIKK